MAVNLKVYTCVEELAHMQDEWDNFIEENGSDIFMTYDWCRIWWKYYGGGRDLKIFIFRSNNKLVGIIPLFFEKIWLGPVFVRVIKIVGSDFTLAQFSLPIRDCFLKEVVEGLAEKLYDLDWDIIHIGPIAGKYGNFLDLEKAMDFSLHFFAEVKTEERGVQTYFDLAESWKNQLLTLSKRERGDIRRNYRYVAKVVGDIDKPVQTVVADTNNIQEIFDDFVDMHKDHWNRLNKAGHFGDWPKSADFHYEMSKSQLKHDRLKLFKVCIDGECLGYEYNYKCGQNYFEILNARSSKKKFENISLGKIVFSEHVKKVIDEKIDCIDSMRGHYEHKLRLGGKLYPMHSIYIIKKGYMREKKTQLFRLLSKLYNICYYKIWFSRVAPKVMKKRGSLCKLWIRTQAFS